MTFVRGFAADRQEGALGEGMTCREMTGERWNHTLREADGVNRGGSRDVLRQPCGGAVRVPSQDEVPGNSQAGVEARTAVRKAVVLISGNPQSGF